MFFNVIAATAATAASRGSGLISIGLMLFMYLYFLPSVFALAKRNKRTKVILFNIFLGWTIVMWIISLVWACKKDEPNVLLNSDTTVADEIKKYKELLDSAAITQEEYEEKKKQLLDL